MEEKKVPMNKTALTYGLALGGILILLELIFYSLDKQGVTSAVIGHHGLPNLNENIEIVKEFSKVSCLRKDWGALEKKMEEFS